MIIATGATGTLNGLTVEHLLERIPAEQIGVSKVTNVGQTSLETVGKFKKVIVGEEFVIECGASKFIMRKDGTVIILGTQFNFTASGPTQINGTVVDLNKPGGGFEEADPSESDSTAKG